MSDQAHILPDLVDPQVVIAEKDEHIARLEQQNEALKNLLKQEITHKESISKALRYHLTKHEELVNAVPWIVLLISKNLTYLDVNRFYASIYDLKTHDMTDQQVGNFDEAPAMIKAIREFVQTDEMNTVSKEVQLSSHGKDHHFLLILFRNKLGEHISVIGIDITDRVKTEQALINAKNRLEKTSKELEAAALEANQLASEADIANKAKSDFLSTMSHELRTPLNGIIGMASLLTNSELDEEYHEYADIILTSGESLLKIINDILDISKIEAGKIELEEIRFDLADLFSEIDRLFTFQAYDKGVKFYCSLEQDISTNVQGDPGRLKQVLVNLINNALKFTQEGEICIYGKLLEESETKIAYQFSVTDSGIGISKEVQDRLFNPFVQADSSTTRQYGGTGLGLSICKQLVELMGGAISVDSTVDEGSKFSFSLWLKK